MGERQVPGERRVNGLRASLIRAAFTAYKEGHANLAFALYTQLADAGHPESQVFTAWLLSQGIGCTKDEAKAATYYERAAALGNAGGCFYYGRWLTKVGEHERAYGFYSQGEKCGHLPSTFRVGYSLARGKGVNVDLPRAYEALKAAAAHGHAYALREIAVQDLRGGRGLPWIPIGFLGFVAALFWGTAVSMFNKDSDLLRG
jgi:TPR repeat protein